MNTEDYDVIEMDFPPYSADGFKLPDIEQESSFNENKNEIYLRNIAIAKEEEVRLAAEEKAVKAAKKAEFERMYESSKPAVKNNKNRRNAVDNIRLIFAILSLVVIPLAMISGAKDKGSDIDTSVLKPAVVSRDVEAAHKQARQAYGDCTSAAAKAAAEAAPLSGYIIEGKDSEIYMGSVKTDISDYRSFEDGYVYGSFSEGYGVDYVLWSVTPIPVEYRHRLTEKEAEKIAKKEGLAIGCYPLLSEDDTRSLPADESLPLGKRYTDIFDIQYSIAKIEPLENYPEEYEESGGKELAVTVDFTFENIKNDKGAHGLTPKVMCLDLGDSNYIRPFYGSSDNFESAYNGSSVMFLAKGYFTVTYFVDADELRKAQGIAYRISEYEYEKSKTHDVPNFKIAFDASAQSVIDEYIEEADAEERLKTTAVREPFEAADGEIVYSNDVISCKVRPSCTYEVDDKEDPVENTTVETLEVTVRNLTDFDYTVRPDYFRISSAFDMGGGEYAISGYNEVLADYDENGGLIRLHFDENNLCSFTVTSPTYVYHIPKYTLVYRGFMTDDTDFNGFSMDVRVSDENIHEIPTE